MSMEPSTFTGISNGVNYPIDRSQSNRSLKKPELALAELGGQGHRRHVIPIFFTETVGL